MSQSLLDAASQGDLQKVRAQLDKGADLQWQHKATGRTALTAAAIAGHLDVAQLLVERGADLNWRDSAVGLTPLGWASECNHAALVEYFLQAGADPNLPTHEFLLTPLMVAYQHGRLAIVRLLLKAGVNLDAATCDGRTALQIARKRKQTDVVKALEAAGATLGTPAAKPERIPWPRVDQTGKSPDYSTPETVLRGFILAMNRYEKHANHLRKIRPVGRAVNAEILKAMQSVFDVYCTPLPVRWAGKAAFKFPPNTIPRANS